MSLKERPQDEQMLEYFSAIAEDWLFAIVTTECKTAQIVELRGRIANLTEEIIDLLSAEILDNDKAQAIGVQLATDACANTQPALLPISQRILTEKLLQNFPVPLPQSKVAQLLGAITIGYFSAGDGDAAFPLREPPAETPTEAPLSAEQVEDFKKLKVLELAVTNTQLKHEIAEQKQIEAELRQYNRELTLVNRASQVFYSNLDTDQVVVTILDELHSMIDVYAYSVWLIDRQANEIVCWRATDVHREVMLGWRLPLGQGIVGTVAQRCESIIVSDTRAESRHFKTIDRQLGIEIRSILSVPLRGKQNVVGVVQIVDTLPKRFGESDQALLESLAEAAGRAIENAKRYEKSQQEAESKSVLLREINHRVKNNLAVIKSILHLKRSRLTTEEHASYQAITEDVMNHVQGLATVHNLLSTSDWSPLPLSELASRVINTSLKVLSPDKYVSVKVLPSTVWVTADQAHDMALITNELVTNTVKHALPHVKEMFEIRVQVSLDSNIIQYEFKDNGSGYPESVLSFPSGTHHFGFELISQIVHHNLDGEVRLANDNGAVAIIEFCVANSEDS